MANIEEKSIEQLVQTTNFIIPEIQREYVWGSKANVALLKRFIDDIAKYEASSELKNIGFLYSYIPNYDNESLDAYLIDGQQRFSTLFLLLFYCSLQTNRLNDFIELFKIDTDTENTKFDYRVRNLTHDFIIALIKNVDTVEKLKNVKSATWFLSVFKNDVSIKNILEAFNTFETELNKQNIISFDYLKEKVMFWHFQTETTSQGEELYITMNSRGESVEDYENIKAALFKQEQKRKFEFGKKYSIWEDFFWKLSDKAEDREITFNYYMNTFFEIVLQCETGSEKFLKGNNQNQFTIEERNKLTFSILEKYMFSLFNAVEFIEKNREHFGLENIVSEFFKRKSNAQDKIPLIALLLFFKDSIQDKIISKKEDYLLFLREDEQREIARIYHFFYNNVRGGKTEQNAVIRLMEEQKLSFSEYQRNRQIQIDKLIESQYDESDKNKQIKNLLSKHEIDKLRIIKESTALRNRLEDKFWQIQKKTFYILEGSLRILFDAMEWQENYIWDNAILNKFNEHERIFSTLWSKENIKKPLCDNSGINNSLITRGLLTIGDYAVEYGGANFSFGYDKTWNIIMKEKAKIIVQFLQKLYNQPDYIVAIKEIIDEYVAEKEKDKKDWIYYFVKYPRMTQPDNRGQNVFTWWSDYNIRVLQTPSRHGYDNEPYTMTLYFEEPNPKSFKQPWGKGVLINGLIILAANELNTWIIKVPSNIKVNLENLSRKYRNFNTTKNGDVDYFYKYDDTEDFIKEGIRLVKEVAILDIEDKCLQALI